ncbi:glycosyltransferase family 1 protein [Paenibacillus glycanilyticus]|uniref:Glycosyltransferase EpsF n=1 Tax=Paenibacillus glycanilyticus TaxID=126569 RepID=A0ABQ6G8Q0_9BACL|nr:glycosyltransferase family 1 protein [Paenibacillus glycanilyticus]GLX67321.1 putative glycosyltransferase EpsF [Paenibacillus glycanilyticus]
MSHTKIKVLHVVGRMHPGGIETLLMNVYRNIDRDKYEFHFAVQSAEPSFYDDEIRELGGTIFVQPPPKDGIRSFRKQLMANMKKYGPYAAVHSHVFGFSGYVLKLAEQLDVPVRISHSHNTSDSKSSSVLRNLYRTYMRSLISRYSTNMLGCSRAACESLFGTTCWKDGRVDVFPNAITLAPYESLERENRQELRRRFGAAEDELLIGHIGRFSKQKNHALLLDSFASLIKLRPNARLLLCGDGPLRAEMEEKARTLGIAGKVQFLGLRKDVPELLGALDAFVLPSLYEGLGIVLIEAQAAGVPCLISEEVPREADLRIGLIERLALSDSPERWAEALVTLSERKGHGGGEWQERATALGERGYDIRVSAAKLERLYAG